MTTPTDPSVDAASFWRTWPLAKSLVYVAYALFILALVVTTATGSAWVERGAGLLLFLGVWNWLQGDRRQFPHVAAQYGGVALYVFWPVLIPLYHAQTRRWTHTAAALAAAFLVTIIVFALGVAALAVAGYTAA